MQRDFVILLSFAVILGCSTHSARRVPKPNAEHANRVLTADDIRSPQYGTAYEALQHLRPEFLRPRRAIPKSEVIVYVNDIMVGGLDQLHAIRAAQIDELRYLDAREATMRFGTGHPDGAILILLGRSNWGRP